MKAIVLLLVCVFAATGCKSVFGPRVQGSGKVGTRSVQVGAGKEIGAFKQIKTSGAFEIEIKQGPQSDLVITGDDNVVKIVTLKNDGDVLRIGTSEDYSSNVGLKISVTMPTVEGLEINGSGNARLSGIDTDKLQLQISGSGDIKVNGRAKELAAGIDGSGEIDAIDLASETAQASISGSGSIHVFATKVLAGSVSGSGEVRYKGSPKVSRSISGSGEVEPL